MGAVPPVGQGAVSGAVRGGPRWCGRPRRYVRRRGAVKAGCPIVRSCTGLDAENPELPIPPNTGRSAGGDPVAGAYATADGSFPVVCGVCALRAPARHPFLRGPQRWAADRSTGAADLRQQHFGPTRQSPAGRQAVALRAPSSPQTDHDPGRPACQRSALGHRPAVVAAHLAPAHNGEKDIHPEQSTWRSAAGWLGSTDRGLARHRTAAVAGLHHRPPRLRQARGRQVPRATRRLARNRRRAGHR
jgi:hypothetical protein